jgi:DNA-binding MarR family transcriptional regulator
VDGLESDGLVKRCSCLTDKRGTFVELTEKGMSRLREAAATHIDGVRDLFLGRIPDREAMDEILAALPGGADCDVEDRACMAQIPTTKKTAAR